MTRERAVEVAHGKQRLYPNSVLYVSHEPVRREDFALRVGVLPEGSGPCAGLSWVALVDLVPDASWAHECVYLFLDAGAGDFVREAHASWYPVGWSENYRREDL